MINTLKHTISSEKRIRSTTVQSNHDGCILPPELIPWKDDPLYQLVARWCQMQKAWVGRKQIAHAFQITERRASFQISYLTRKPKFIRCEVRRNKNEGAPNSSYEVWVHDVCIPQPPPFREKETMGRKSRGRRKQRVGNIDSSLRAMLNQLWPKP